VAKCAETGACGLPAPHVHYGVEASQKKWWFKLAEEYQAGRTQAAIFIGFSIEILQVTQSLERDPRRDQRCNLAIPLDFPMCFPRARIDYDRDRGGVRTPGGSPPHASVIVLLPSSTWQIEVFRREFKDIGKCLLTMSEKNYPPPPVRSR